MRRLLVLFLTFAALAACTSSGSKGTSAAPASSGAPSSAPSSSAAPKQQFYVSLGDSYAAGYQATGLRKGHTTANGFAYQIVSLAKAKGYDLKLANFGCAGATTTSIIKAVGCPAALLGPGSTAYPAQTQAAAAEAFLRAHQGQVGLVTVSIGGNDVTACGVSADAITCLTKALAVAKANLTTLLSGLRTAAGPSTRIVGITYPDVLLGNYLSKDATVKALATVSTVAFQQYINPTLKAAYAAVNGGFADVTAATGAYGSFSQTVTVAPYGAIPLPVAKICQLTFYCQYQDIHPRTPGYAIIANLVVAQLPKA